MDLIDTISFMKSTDYKERFIAEYYQLLIRLDKLRAMMLKMDNGTLSFIPTCPRSTFAMQIRAMEDYLGVMEARAVMEGININ